MRFARAFFCGLTLAACSQSPNPSIPASDRFSFEGHVAAVHATSGGYTYLYGFKGGPDDGKWPGGPLAVLGGTIYGVTFGGGLLHDGVVYAFVPPSAERVVHAFHGGRTDGSVPTALTSLDGVLYGVTSGGGAHYHGAVFRLTPSGSETLLYSFTGGSDGMTPADLVRVGATFYGVTESGGTFGYGTAFAIDQSGDERTLHEFSGKGDGGTPFGGLLVRNGTIYGTTVVGGSGCYTIGCGTVFSMATSGTIRTIYRFLGGSDGAYPEGPLAAIGTTLYAMTPYDGPQGFGAIHSVTPSGSGRVVYRFRNEDDGNDPTALITVAGSLYATSGFGDSKRHEGSLIELNPSGAEKTLHEFSDTRYDGGAPFGRMALLNDALYGATQAGGPENRGTIYRFTP